MKDRKEMWYHDDFKDAIDELKSRIGFLNKVVFILFIFLLINFLFSTF